MIILIKNDITPDYFIDTRSGNNIMPSMHHHSSYELYYLLAGSRDYFIEDKFFSISSGSFVLIPPSTLHRTGGKYGLRTLIGFKTAFLNETFNETTLPDLLKCFENRVITPPENKREYFETLLQRIEKSKSRTEFSLLLSVLLFDLSKYENDDCYNQHITEITSYINKNYFQINSIEQIAEHFYISKYHLCRIFKDALQMTLIDYINGVKIKNACHYIEASNKNFLEIAKLCGFNSLSYFSTVFKKTTGQTPSEYEKNSRNKL